MRALRLAFLLSLGAASSWADPLPDDGDSVYFDEAGVGRALSHESRDDAVARAKEDALSKTMRRAADVFYDFSDYSSQMGGERYESVARHIFMSNRGVLVEESVDRPACELADTVTVCRVRVRGRIVFNGKPDAAFRLAEKTPQGPLGLDRAQYFDGEDVRLRLSPTKDAYLYVFGWDNSDRINLLFPNRSRRENKVVGGETLSIPEPRDGVAYRAKLPEGKSVASERLLVVACKKVLPLPNQEGLAKLAEIMRALATLDRSDWVMQVIPYQIKARALPAR